MEIRVKQNRPVQHNGSKQNFLNGKENSMGIKKVAQLDLAILYGLYELRALSYEQIKRRYNLKERYLYLKLRLLKESGYIATDTIVHYKTQRYQGKYARITDVGLTLLKQNGFQISEKIRQHHLEVAKHRLAGVLSINDVFIDTEKYGWRLLDSREVKKKHDLNRGSLILGELQHEKTDSRYAVYNFSKGTETKTLDIFIRELIVFKTTMLLNYMIFVKDEKLYGKIIRMLWEADNNSLIARLNKISVVPFKYGKYYLAHLDEKQNAFYFLINDLKLPLESVELPLKKGSVEAERNQQQRERLGLNKVVKYNTKEYYYVNLLDMDLKKIQQIKSYSYELFVEDNRKLLIITPMPKIVESLIGENQFVEYLPITIPSIISKLEERETVELV